MHVTRKRGIALAAFIFCSIAASLLYRMIGSGSIPTVHADFPRPDSEIPITQWYLVGPFHFDSRELDNANVDKLPVGLNRDYLAQLGGTSEASIDSGSLSTLKTAPDCGLSTGLYSASADTNIMDFAVGGKHCDNAVAYLATIIESPADQNIVIATGADDNHKIWLNHEEILADPLNIHRFIKKYAHLTRARLKKGKNLLLVKAGNITGDWRLIVTLFPDARGLDLAEGNGVNPVLVHSVIPESQLLEIRNDLIPSAGPVRATISDARHRVIDSWELGGRGVTTRAIGELEKNRVYLCRLEAKGRVVERPFYYGDTDAGFSRLAKLTIRSLTDDDLIRAALQAPAARLRFLLQPGNQSKENWDQKVAAGFAEMEANLTYLEKGVDAFRRAPGTHIRGYRSSVDGQMLNYWVHIPEGAVRSNKPMPLVVVLPGTWLENQPFLDSPQVTLYESVERYRLLGDEFGFAVLQVWGRGNNLGGTAIWNRDVLEAIDAVRRDYSIDDNRLFLVGACEGGRQALLLAERHPHRFAAVAVYGPSTTYSGADWRFDRWTDYSSPVVSVANLVGTHVFINHNINDKIPVHDSELFVNNARAAGVDASLVTTSKGFHGFSQDPMGDMRSLFESLKDRSLDMQFQTGKGASEHRGFGAGQGPIEDAFGAPILVVEGTSGTAQQRASVHALTQEVLSEWKQAYFVDCPSKRDINVTESDLARYNLVLVGDRETNTLLGRFVSGLPVSVTPTRLSVGNRTYKGSQLGYEFIAINPLRPTKYFVVVGMNHWGPLNGWQVHPSREGIADFMVFDLQGPSAQLWDAGYYEPSYWKRSDEEQAEDGQN